MATRILIVGGGIGGMAAAIKLREQNHEVDLIDIDPEWRVYGAGITITGPTLRAYKHLDMVDAIATHGAITNGTKVNLFNGTLLHELDEPALEEGLPATGGIMRPVLHELMQERVNGHNVNVRLGVTVDEFEQNSDNVAVTFSDGSSKQYDLVIGADGVNSRVRELLFPNAVELAFTGQGCWRISMKRPPGFDFGEIYVGHERPAGITACGPDSVYMFMLSPDDRTRIPEEENFERLQALTEPFGGNIKWIRDNMTPDDWINYRPLQTALQPKPWFDGRVVLLGDAVHATTPHLASGAGMAVESAVVLAQEIESAQGDIDAALAAYVERRYDRCKDIVESSLAIGEAQLAGSPPDVLGGLMGAALHRLAEPF